MTALKNVPGNFRVVFFEAFRVKNVISIYAPLSTARSIQAFYCTHMATTEANKYTCFITLYTNKQSYVPGNATKQKHPLSLNPLYNILYVR
jgi:hypothetical protein